MHQLQRRNLLLSPERVAEQRRIEQIVQILFTGAKLSLELINGEA